MAQKLPREGWNPPINRQNHAHLYPFSPFSLSIIYESIHKIEEIRWVQLGVDKTYPVIVSECITGCVHSWKGDGPHLGHFVASISVSKFMREIGNLKACHFSCFQFQLWHQRSLLRCHYTFCIYGLLVKKAMFRFLKDCVLAILSSKMSRRCPSNVL